MNRSKFFFILLLISIFLIIAITCTKTVNAVGIQAPSSEERLIIFQPGLEIELPFSLINANRIHSYLTAGALSEYAELIDNAQDTGPRSLKLKIKLPEKLEPGKYEIYVGGKEMAENTATVAALAAIQARIVILSLYDEAYPIMSLGLTDLGVNQSANFSIGVDNFGKKPINAAYGTIAIYDENEKLITTLTTETKPVGTKIDNPVYSEILKAEFTPSKYSLKPGIYNAVGKLYYDNKELQDSKSGTFRIGTLSLTITDWTKQFFKDSPNKFRLVIESDWTGTIEDVYAKIITPNRELRTPNININRFAQSTLETYWETNGLALGDYDVDIQVFYNGQSVSKKVTVSVIEGKPPVEEMPAKKEINYMLPLLIVLVACMVFMVYYFVFRKSRNSGDNTP